MRGRIAEPKPFYFPLRGGLDLVTPPYQIKPGKLLSCLRYEIAASGGLKPVDGFERTDGHGLPSEALFQTLVFVDPALVIAVDTVITGDTSGASGISLLSGLVDYGDGVEVDTTGSGSFLIDGVFVTGEDIRVAGLVVGQVAEANTFNAADTDLKEGHLHWLAVEKRRALVQKVPGSGPIRGVWRYKGNLYAFRDNVLATGCFMYKEDPNTGWVVVTTPALVAGGAYRFENMNFHGGADTFRMYGCDGKNKAFEFDGTTFTQITTGYTPDTPFLITEHKMHLFLGMPGGWVQHSPPTDPTGVWTIVMNAGAIGTGEELTAIKSLPGDVLGIWGQDSIRLVSGSGVPWTISMHSKETGGIMGTVQNTGRILFLNNTGIAELSATNAYGDFKSGTISNDIQPLIDSLKKRAICSVAVAAKNQYRLFFEDGYSLTASFIGREVQFTQSQYDVVVRCISAPTRADDEMGNIYFGSDDGYIYKMDSGVSMDHEPMMAYFRLPYSHQGAPRQKKRYRELVLELEAASGGTLSLNISPDFSFSDPTIPANNDATITSTSVQAAIWDEADWNSFEWNNVSMSGGGGIASCRINGVASEMGLLVYFNAAKTTTPLHVLNGVFIYYNLLGRVR